MRESQERQGECFILLEALLWSLFPVITILSFDSLSPLASMGWSNLFATIFFGGVLTFRKRWGELKNRSSLKDILWTTFFLGILYYLLSFVGLRYTSAGNASLIALTEIFFSFIFFHLWRKDFISRRHIIGAVLMLIGAVIVLYPNTTRLRLGDVLILMAAMIAPFGNFFQQRARKMVSSEGILFVRSLVSMMVVTGVAFVARDTLVTRDFKQVAVFLLMNGFLLLGVSKILWIEGIHRISVTRANALASISPPLTLLFAWLFLHNIPTPFQLSSVVPISFGVLFLSMNGSSRERNERKKWKISSR